MNNMLEKRSIATTLFIFGGLTLCCILSCKKDNIKQQSVLKDNFYVKYIIYSNYPRIFSNWSVSTANGNYTKNDYQTRRWEETYGPIKSGFRCEVKVGNGEPTIEIHVSKNQEPFTLKSFVNGKSAFYIIQ